MIFDNRCAYYVLFGGVESQTTFERLVQARGRVVKITIITVKRKKNPVKYTTDTSETDEMRRNMNDRVLPR